MRINLSRFLADKRADDGFADAVQGMAARQLKADALGDVGHMAVLGLGAGAAGRGLIGLVNMLRPRPKKVRGGPATVSLPYPVKQANFLGGDAATTKAGIPWYGPAMLGAGLGGLGLGFKGVDALLERRRKAQQERELEAARREFSDALMGSYTRPVASHLKAAGDGDAPLVAAGRVLDGAFEKLAVDLPNLGGAALGGYGMYAGLSGLLAGALVYDRMQKRSRRSVLDKALQRRERRKFMQSPTELQAVPEPVPALEG